MEITITSENQKTIIKVQDKDIDKLIDAVYWFLRDNKINPIVETTNL